MKAIETVYKGYRFRSRLEARWAVFFDALEIKWQYEPEGFEKVEEEGSEPVRYLPDFYLPESATWVEVKGGVISADDAIKMARILDYGSPLWHFSDSGYKMTWQACQDAGLHIGKLCRGLIMLGDIPDLNHGSIYHPIIRHAKGLTQEWVKFRFGGIESVEGGEIKLAHLVAGLNFKYRYADGYGSSAKELRELLSTSPVVVEQKLAVTATKDAYTSARQARFEFGEAGAMKAI